MVNFSLDADVMDAGKMLMQKYGRFTLSAEEVAAELCVDLDDIGCAISSGDLKSKNIGSKLRVTISSLLSYMADMDEEMAVGRLHTVGNDHYGENIAETLKGSPISKSLKSQPASSGDTLTGDTLVQVFVEEFLKRDISSDPNKTSRTCDNYSNCIKHYKDTFYNRTINSITVGDLKEFFQALSNEYGDSMVTKVYWLVKNLYNWAYEHEYICSNPFDSGYLKRVKSGKESPAIESYSKDEHKSIMGILKENEFLYIIIQFMWETGVRAQEAIGLRWKNLNLIEKYVVINEAITLEVTYDERGHKHCKSVLGDTKTKSSRRIIGLSPELARLLGAWKSEAPTVSKTKTGDEDFVFGNSKHCCWKYSGLRSSLNRYVSNRSIKFEKVRLHRIRHSSAMAMAKGGLPMVDIMATLGHSQMKTTKQYFDLVADKIDPDSLKKRLACLAQAGIISSER